MATITREPSGAWRSRTAPQPLLLRRPPPDGLRLRLPRVRGQTSPFATACSSFAPPRPATTRSAADFYHSQLWPTVRFWERAFWILNGGERRARDVVLRRLPKSRGLRLLDVAIGDGVYTSWLRQEWSIVGVDISTTLLAACRRRNCGRSLRLVLSEAEDLPFRDREFDAVLSNGGFNHFNDPEAALREMARVAKAGALVVAHEMPDFLAFGIGWACPDWTVGLRPG